MCLFAPTAHYFHFIGAFIIVQRAPFCGVASRQPLYSEEFTRIYWATLRRICYSASGSTLFALDHRNLVAELLDGLRLLLSA